jgi:hypothetical protein
MEANRGVCMKFLIVHIYNLNALLKEYLEFEKISESYCIACRFFLMINK